VGQRGADNGAPLITDRTGQELKTAAQTTLKAQKPPTGNRRLENEDWRLETAARRQWRSGRISWLLFWGKPFSPG